MCIRICRVIKTADGLVLLKLNHFKIYTDIVEKQCIYDNAQNRKISFNIRVKITIAILK